MRVRVSGNGVLEGTTLFNASGKPKCHRFSGVPYALPPTGDRRWKRPVPLPAAFFYGNENAPGKFEKPSSVCPQFPVTGGPVPNSDEDCLQSNIWVPIGEPPSDGWPVFFYIHGGFLQVGSNNAEDPSALISETDVKCIIVSPNYRLGIFGFLSSKEICGLDSSEANFGLWDQRLALEWTYENIEFFGGNKHNITIGGLSAGSYSTFHQLAHDIKVAKRQLVRRVFQWSNGCGVQPKRLAEAQGQFENLLGVLKIPSSWDSARKLEALREKNSEELVSAVGQINQKFFRPILDGHFMSKDLFPSIFNGSFGARMKLLNIQTIIGDLTQEFHLYKNVFPPNSYESLVDRLSWDYPRHIALAVSEPYKLPMSSPKNESEWHHIFGKLYADIQIHSTMRGLVHSIGATLPLSHIHRYRIDWRAAAVDKNLPRYFGATHGTDLAIWFYGNGDSLKDEEKVLIKAWLEPVASFLKGEQVQWGTQSIDEVRYINWKGQIEIKRDEWWNDKLLLWEVTKQSTQRQALATPNL